VTRNAWNLDFVHDKYKADKSIVLAAVNSFGGTLQYASDELRADREVVITAVSSKGVALEYASEELQADREVVLTAVTTNGNALGYASEELQADREVVHLAVATSGQALDYTTTELQSDREVVLTAISSNERALLYASDELKNDINFLRDAILKNTKALRLVSEHMKQNCLNDSMEYICEGAFSECTHLKTIKLPDAVKCIGHEAFLGCTGLQSIKLPSDLISIATTAFKDCNNMNLSIEIPPSIYAITLVDAEPYQFCNNNKEEFEESGILWEAFNSASVFSPVSIKIFGNLGLNTKKYHIFNADWRFRAFVNWGTYSNNKNEHGRWPLHVEAERNLKWSEGLCEILEANGRAIEERDEATNMEAFMLAANGNLETIYSLLLDHPAVINPYVSRLI